MYTNICDVDKCTGCMACLNACIADAIVTYEDSEGFYRPRIKDELCSNCGTCYSVCPVNHPVDPLMYDQRVYACWHIEPSVRKQSTSGGVFSALSNYVLGKGGIVFGAAFDQDHKVTHTAVSDDTDLHLLRGSKYVQSRIDTTYRQVKHALKQGKVVLFSGTPCQVSALYAYLGGRHERLYTCDLVCHGVPSPKVFADYLDFIENIYRSKVSSVNFRCKDKSWTYFGMKIILESGKAYFKDVFHDPFLVGFLRDLFNRPSCYKCSYTNTDRVGDLTIADYWGYSSHTNKDKNDDKGISLVIVNTPQGDSLLAYCDDDIVLFNRTLENAVRGNPCLSRPFPPAADRDQFWKCYNDGGFESIVETFLSPKKVRFEIKVVLRLGMNRALWVLRPVSLARRVLRCVSAIRTTGNRRG